MKIFNLPDISIKSFQLPLPLNVNLQQREKLAITIAGIAIIIFLVIKLIIFPAINHRDSLRKKVIAKTKELQEIHELKAKYQLISSDSQSSTNRLKTRTKTFNLFSFIDRLSGRSGIKGNIISMKPSTSNIKNSSYKLSSVEMKLNALTMEQLTKFIHGVETSRNVIWIKRVTITKADKKENTINALLQIETFQR